ncbi:ABC transporter substrate-binding protein [Consotaella aegiceratis]|uniref:ABC transporter substrate-binding protein n=1 Tax=Consotaella aegiceratis TaxID=3097961 RepID=UPI002F400DC2
MNRMHRRLSATAALAMGGFCLPVAATAGEVTWWAPNWEQPRVNQIIEDFQAEYPDIKVNLETTVAEGLQNKILVALQSGSPPDVIDSQNGWNIPFAAQGLLSPIDELMADKDLDWSDFLDSGLATTKYDGAVYGLPYRIESHAVIINRGMFRDAGLDPDNPPQTWDEFAEAAKALTKTREDGTEQYGFAITGGGEFGNTVYRSVPFLRMNGGGILDADGKVVVNTSESVAGLKFYTDFYTDLKTSPPSTLENDGIANRQLFSAGAVAMYQSGQYDLATIHKENPDIETGSIMLPHPEGKDTTALLGGWNWIVPADAPNKEDAATLLAYLARPEVMGVYTDTFPARDSAMSQPRFQDPELKAFRDMLPYARAPWPVPNWTQMTQTYFTYVQEVLVGSMEPQEAMDAAAEEIEPLTEGQ